MSLASKVATLAGLAAAFLCSGCEIALVVAAATDDDSTVDYESYVPCNETSSPDAGYLGLQGKEGKAQLYAQSVSAPTQRLALGEHFNFFVITPDLEPGGDFRVVVDGVLTRTDTSVGSCGTWYGQAGSFVSVDAAKIGASSIVIEVDGAEYDRFDLEVAEPTSLELSWNSGVAQVHANLLDDQGDEVYAWSGITWEFAPTPAATPTAGPDSGPIFPSGTNQEIQVFAFYGDLTASMTLVTDESFSVHPK